MLKFYYNRLSINARRVWIVLLEKQIPFEPILMNLDGDQFQSEFLEINPFHHIPVLVDDELSIVESFAILDYLEAKYPTPPFLPTDAKSIAIVRMVEMVTLNELLPATFPLLREMVGLPEEAPQKLDGAKQQVAKVLSFFERHLNGDRPYFVGEQLTLADVVAGTTVPSLPLFGVSLDLYPRLQKWSENLLTRNSWQQTAPTPEEIEAFKPRIKALLEKQ